MTSPYLTDSHTARKRTWDYSLTMATVVLLGGVGLQSFVGTLYAWWAQRTMPGWATGAGYERFVTVMNAIAAPQVILLVVVMGLCVPKRLFSRDALLWVSAGMVLAGLITSVATGSVASGLGLYLILAALIQVAVVVLTIAGTKAPSYLTEGRLTKIGSGLLHLGFVVFMYVVVALQHSTFMLPVFWVAAALTSVGTTLSFYAEKFAVRRSASRPHPTARE